MPPTTRQVFFPDSYEITVNFHLWPLSGNICAKLETILFLSLDQQNQISSKPNLKKVPQGIFEILYSQEWKNTNKWMGKPKPPAPINMEV